MSSPFVEDWRAALGLRAFLMEGGTMTPSETRSLTASEKTYAVLPGSLARQEGVELALASSDPSTHALARQWRAVASGQWHLTSARLALVDTSGVARVSLGWVGLLELGADEHGLLATYETGAFRVNVGCPQWLLVAVYHLGFSTVAASDPPAWVTRELRTEP